MTAYTALSIASRGKNSMKELQININSAVMAECSFTVILIPLVMLQCHSVAAVT